MEFISLLRNLQHSNLIYLIFLHFLVYIMHKIHYFRCLIGYYAVLKKK